MKIETYYELFTKGSFSKENLKTKIVEYAYTQVTKDRYIEAGDFILEFIPRVEMIIESYNDLLASFTHYINKHIKWLMYRFSKKYIELKEKKEAYQYHCIAEFKDNFSLLEIKSEYKISNNAKKLLSISNGVVLKDSTRKRLEIFTLKNSRNLTNEQIEILAPLINRSCDWIYHKKEILDEKCRTRVKNREYLEQRFNRLFVEITKDQKKLTLMNEGEDKNILFEKMRMKQERKSKLCLQISKRNCGPKNDEIAQLLNIPKGTVDSSLFYIKKELATLLPNLKLE